MELTAQPNSKRPYLKQSAKQEQTPRVVSDIPILRMCTTAHTSTHTHACTQTCTQLKEREREIDTIIRVPCAACYSCLMVYNCAIWQYLVWGGGLCHHSQLILTMSPLYCWFHISCIRKLQGKIMYSTKNH